MITRLFSRELILIVFLLVLFIGIRSVHFPTRFNFSTEQAVFASKSHEIWTEKKLELLGPPISYRLNGRYLFQGSITYYMILLFLVPANFDPVISSYLFMLFCAFMMIPLYYGAKMLTSQRKALFVVLIYGLLPLYIDYTTFFWNPNFQFSLIPLLVLGMGLHHKTKQLRYLVFVGFFSGVLLLFHYQFFLVILILSFFYLKIKKLPYRDIGLFVLSVLTGFGPMVVFELRNQFYNTQTLILFLRNAQRVFGGTKGFHLNGHYFLSVLLILILLFLVRVRWKLTTFTRITLFFIFRNLPMHSAWRANGILSMRRR